MKSKETKDKAPSQAELEKAFKGLPLVIQDHISVVVKHIIDMEPAVNVCSVGEKKLIGDILVGAINKMFSEV
jgi:hypothetical protein